MDDLLRQVVDYLRGMWQRRWAGLVVAWLVAAIGAAWVWRMPDQYEATARVYVDTASVLRPLMSGLTVSLDTEQQIAMLSKTLISRPNLEKLMQMADLEVKARSQGERDALLDGLARSLRLSSASRDARDNLYTISYREERPDEARRVVQALLSIFVESSLGDKRKDADQARRFIEEQIKIYEKRLEDAENRVKEFKLRNLGSSSGDGRDFFARMNGMQEDLQKARLELRAAEQSRDAIKRELAGEQPVFLPEPGFGTPGTGDGSSAGSIAIPELDTRIDTLRKQLDELQRRYTEQHPDVIGTRRILTDLEEQRRQEVESRRKAQAAELARASKANAPARVNPADRNPVFQQLKVQLAEQEAAVAALRARVTEYDGRLGTLRQVAQRAPQVEAELAQLNRDYDVQKKAYESLVQRRESAALSGEMDATGTAEFKVIDPPRVTPQPVAPNRLLLMTGAFLAALGAGAAVSFLFSQAAPTFHDSRALRAVTQRPVLGAVSMVTQPTALRKRRRGLMAFLGLASALFAAYGAVMALLMMTARVAAT